MTWHRTFHFKAKRPCFDATMIYDSERSTIVDYLGTHQHVAADLNCWVDDDGGLKQFAISGRSDIPTAAFPQREEVRI